MTDFRHYFPHHNPSTLGHRFSPEARRAIKMEKSELMRGLEKEIVF
jgi:hypothetical protein